MTVLKRNLEDVSDIIWWLKGFVAHENIYPCGGYLFVSDHIESLIIALNLMKLEYKNLQREDKINE